MNKVICDICGTSYPETSEQCPICGYSRDSHVEPLAEDFLLSDDLDLDEILKSDVFAEEDVRKPGPDAFEDKNEVVDEDDDEYGEEEDEDDEEEDRRPNTVLIVLLVIIILALLAVTGFIFVKYFLPDILPEESEPTQTAAQTETTVETTEPTIPCTSLVMTSGSTVELDMEGGSWLLNVVVVPEDTTDKVMYSSSDESIVTVNEEGKLTAVAEGEATITITCGAQTLDCQVIVNFSEDNTIPEATEDEETTEATEDVEATEAPTEAETTNLTLKLNKTDITFNGIGQYFTFEITDGIDVKDVTWGTGNARVCTIKDGVVRITGEGVTYISAKYGSQEVRCVIRCSLPAATTPAATTPAAPAPAVTTPAATAPAATTPAATTPAATTPAA